MALLQNGAEGGTNGTTPTTLNTGGASGDALSNIAAGTGSLSFTNTTYAHGSLGYSFTGAASSAEYLGWNGISATSIATRFYYNAGSSLPGAQLTLISIRSASAKVALALISTTGKIVVQNSAGTNLFTFSNALSANTFYRIELSASVSTAAATVKCAYYAGDSSTPVETAYSTTTANTGSANITEVRFGSGASASWTGTAYMDDLAALAGTTTFIGAYTAPGVPGAPTGPAAIAGNTQATITYSTPASNGGATITGYTATSTPGGFTGSVTGASASAITVLGLTNGTSYTFTVHATNANGNSAESVATGSVTPVTPGGVLVNNSAEGGANGVTVSTANSGGSSGDALTNVNLGTGAAIFSSASSAHGSNSYAITGASGSVTYVGWNGYNDTSMATRFYYNMGSALPSTQLTLLAIRSTGAKVALINISAGGKLSVQDSTGTNVFAFSNALSTSTYYRIEMAVTISASAAVIKADYYVGDSTSPAESGYVTAAGNTGSANISEVRIGSGASATWTGTSYFDELAVCNGTTGYIGPSTAPTTPTIGLAVSTPGSVSVNFTPGSTGGSAISAYTATSTPGTITATSTSSPIVYTSGLTPGTSYTFTVHATNSIGTTAESAASNAVTPTIAAPTASAGSPQTVNSRASITLSGSYTTASGHTATLLWTALSGAPAITSGATTTMATIADIGGPTVASAGTAADTTYTYQLTVTQDDAQTASATVVITVSYANRFTAHGGSWQPLLPRKRAHSGSWI